ncbi:filamentous hemagglutinin family protein [Azomonas agilis]|uniref:Filamentous hemagglutinin family protein n=1 Tax=Azomonas agilis TaxID=116849 RepID=A0A562J141_9GAMM|nr:filamentous hemagglutinin N-terminal domain-containing protein [Azomonas agilis]TWH76544.1 filamentous hemagglutinin family protein [Azomonas agilis]
MVSASFGRWEGWQLSPKARLVWLVSIALYSLSPVSLAAPVLGNGGVASGSAVINQSGSVTTIEQSTAKAVINWQSFGVAPAESVQFKQPNASSITLNRVIGNERSVIEGALTANGQVFLINSNGVLFSQGSRVNTAGLVASTLDVSDSDFNAGVFRFKGNGTKGSVTNLGSLNASSGGYIALLGSEVSNQGVVVATRGTVALGAGSQINLRFDGNTLLGMDVEQGVLDALVENQQAIYADGGRVILTAQAADDLLTAQVNNKGLIQAQSIDDLLGEVQLNAGQGVVSLGGSLDISSGSGTGGSISAQGRRFALDSNTRLLASSLTLTTPDSFSLGTNTADSTLSLSTAELATALSQLSVNLSAARGNLEVNAPLSWSANTLGLYSNQNININSVLSATDKASFLASWGPSSRTAVANYDGYQALVDPQFKEQLYNINMALETDAAGQYTDRFVGRIDFNSTGRVQLGETGKLQSYQVIKTLDELRTVTASGNYLLGNDLDLASVSHWTALADGKTFNGNFNGFGHLLTNLKSSGDALFKSLGTAQYSGSSWRNTKITGPSISNLGLTGVDIQAIDATDNSIGALVGTSSGILNHVFASGRINVSQSPMASGYVGGVAGRVRGLVQNSYAKVDITSHNYLYAGGFAGLINGSARLANNAALGNVKVTADPGMFSLSSMMAAGGFVGSFEGDTLIDSYASGAVEGGWYVGGFVGQIVTPGVIYRSLATGSVTLDDRIGPNYDASASEWRNTGAAGGFVGYSNGTISRSASSGRVSALSGNTLALGGFAGYTNSTDIAFSINNFWNLETSGIAFIGRGEGVIPDHSSHHGEGWSSGGGSETPVADALGLTPAQLHQGAQGLSADQFANVQQYQNGPTGQTVTPTPANPQPSNPSGPQTPVDPVVPEPNPSTPGNGSGGSGGGGTGNGGGTGGIAQNPRALLATNQANRIRERYQLELAHTSAASFKMAASGMSMPPAVHEHIHFDHDKGFSANIRSISIDGVQFDLEDEDSADNP